MISSSPLTLNTTHLPVIPDFIPIEQTYSMPPLQCLKESSNLTWKIKFLIFSPVPQVCSTTVHPASEKGESTCSVPWAKIPGVILDDPAPRRAVCQQTWMILPSNSISGQIAHHYPQSYPLVQAPSSLARIIALTSYLTFLLELAALYSQHSSQSVPLKL